MKLEQVKSTHQNKLTRGLDAPGQHDARLHSMQIEGFESKGLFQWLNQEHRPRVDYLVRTEASGLFDLTLQARSFYEGAQVKVTVNYEEIADLEISQNIFEFFSTESLSVKLNSGLNILRLELIGELAVEVATLTIQ